MNLNLILKILQQTKKKMKTEIKNIINLRHFFKISPTKSANSVKYTLQKPSQILIKNIYVNWLQFIHAKTHKQIPVFINQSYKNKSLNSSVFGTINQYLHDYDDEELLEHKLTNYSPDKKSTVQFDLFIPKQDIMQYFIKWQRYRKYWWSSVSTTPSLFAINDIKYEENTANVDVVVQLPCGQQPVENITIKYCTKKSENTSRLSCTMTLEIALITLLLDGLSNNKEEYLRLHRKIAPYKISFALDYKDPNNKITLTELATLLYHKLESKKISTWLPDFSLHLELQVIENRRLGVIYTAVLSESTLENGIFKLVSSNTMLGEQVHVSDFHSYAEKIFVK